ncbi:DUF4336 domain-containing protein [Methylobacterium nigriterrae]|uniref:DUF4336 domain-containing protein n=1 Tax=Methylobacterium nigriterrae TaxID=3127512 RepID=UPI003013259F
MPHETSYPPLNVPKQVADGVWIVDAPPLRAGGMPLPVRMTVIRLSGGELLLHSPVAYTAGLQRALETIGRIGHLVAPSVGHWLFLRDWQSACPGSVTWAVPGLRDRGQVRRAGVRIDAELGDEPPSIWAGEIDQVLVVGPVFKEVCLFHRPSRTLLLTDLVINLEADRLPLLARPLARLLGIVAPDGKAPLYLRLLLRTKRHEVALAARRLVEFDPERVIFAHGRWFRRDAAEQLRDSLAWLLGPSGGAGRARVSAFGDRTPAPARVSTLFAGVALICVIGALAYARRRSR